MKSRSINIILIVIALHILTSLLFFLPNHKQHEESGKSTPQSERYSRVMCYSTNTHRHIEDFAEDTLEIITPTSAKSVIADKFKVCIISNMCINNDGRVLLFLNNSSLNNQSESENTNSYFSSDESFIRKLLVDNPIDGAIHFTIPTRVEILTNINYRDFVKSYRHASDMKQKFRVTDKWITLHTPIFWFNYYHTIVDGFYKLFVTLRQVAHVFNITTTYNNASQVVNVSPTLDFKSIPEFIRNKDYEVFLITKSKKDGWNNKIVPALEQAFPQPQMADSNDGMSLTCSSKGIVGISYSHFRNLYYAFKKDKMYRPRKEGIELMTQYFSFIKENYGITEQPFDTSVKKQLHVLLIHRKNGRTITNLADIKDRIENSYNSSFFEVMIRDNSEHSFKEQIDYHRWADVIIVPHGSDETNAIFAREGTVVIEVESSRHFEPFFLVFSHYMKMRHYIFRGDGEDKNANRQVDLSKFMTFLEIALCYGDDFIKNERIKQVTTQSEFCSWIHLKRFYSTAEIEENLKQRFNLFEKFDKDTNLQHLTGQFIVL